MALLLCGFFINTAFLDVCFILHYDLFFHQEINFFNVYVLVNTVFECRYMFFGWDRGSQLSTYAIGRGTDGHPKCVHRAHGEGTSRLMCTHALTLSLFMFWQHFCLIVCCLFVQV